jgi:hypothetical protein
MRRSLGVAVFSGMLGVTLFGIFLTPVFFSVIQSVGWTAPPKPKEPKHDGVMHDGKAESTALVPVKAAANGGHNAAITGPEPEVKKEGST